jgi:hypothetical protein
MNPLRIFQKGHREGFELNRESLPRESESNSSDEGMQQEGSQWTQETWMPSSTPQDQSAMNPMGSSQMGGGNPIENGGQFSGSMPPQNSQFGNFNQAPQPQQQQPSGSPELQSIETRLQMLDGRIGAMEQKLELLVRLVESEVSEETKQRFRVQEIMEKHQQGR